MSSQIIVKESKDDNTETFAQAVQQTVQSGHGSVTTQDLQTAALIALLQEQIRGEREARERAELREAERQKDIQKTVRAESRNKAASDCCCCLGTTTAVVGTALVGAMVASDMQRY